MTVSVIEQGERFLDLKKNGLRLVGLDGTTIKREPELVTDNLKEAGPQDYVFLAVKAYDLPAVAKNIQYLLGDETAVVTLQNGIPWWYFQKHPGPYRDIRLKSVDPLNNLSAATARRRRWNAWKAFAFPWVSSMELLVRGQKPWSVCSRTRDSRVAQ
jgi:2-dehydropantoate 2-reductase